MLYTSPLRCHASPPVVQYHGPLGRRPWPHLGCGPPGAGRYAVPWGWGRCRRGIGACRNDRRVERAVVLFGDGRRGNGSCGVVGVVNEFARRPVGGRGDWRCLRRASPRPPRCAAAPVTAHLANAGRLASGRPPNLVVSVRPPLAPEGRSPAARSARSRFDSLETTPVSPCYPFLFPTGWARSQRVCSSSGGSWPS